MQPKFSIAFATTSKPKYYRLLNSLLQLPIDFCSPPPRDMLSLKLSHLLFSSCFHPRLPCNRFLQLPIDLSFRPHYATFVFACSMLPFATAVRTPFSTSTTNLLLISPAISCYYGGCDHSSYPVRDSITI